MTLHKGEWIADGNDVSHLPGADDMSGGYDNTNRGSIWGNKRKTTDAHPDFTGTLNVEGVEFFFDAWKRKPGASEGTPSLTFKIKRKDQQPSAEQFKESTKRNFPPDLEDEVPF